MTGRFDWARSVEYMIRLSNVMLLLYCFYRVVMMIILNKIKYRSSLTLPFVCAHSRDKR